MWRIGATAAGGAAIFFDKDKVASSGYWNGDEIVESTGLKLEDVEYHLETV